MYTRGRRQRADKRESPLSLCKVVLRPLGTVRNSYLLLMTPEAVSAATSTVPSKLRAHARVAGTCTRMRDSSRKAGIVASAWLQYRPSLSLPSSKPRSHSLTRRVLLISTTLPVHSQVLPNDLDAWLQLRYAHTYGCTPLERAYARALDLPPLDLSLPLSPSPSILICLSVSVRTPTPNS